MPMIGFIATITPNPLLGEVSCIINSCLVFAWGVPAILAAKTLNSQYLYFCNWHYYFLFWGAGNPGSGENTQKPLFGLLYSTIIYFPRCAASRRYMSTSMLPGTPLLSICFKLRNVSKPAGPKPAGCSIPFVREPLFHTAIELHFRNDCRWFTRSLYFYILFCTPRSINIEVYIVSHTS